MASVYDLPNDFGGIAPAQKPQSLYDLPDNFGASEKAGAVGGRGSALGSSWENFWAGAGKATVDVGRGVKQLMDIPANALEKAFPGISAWSQEKGLPSSASSSAATNADVAESRKTDAELMGTKAGIAGNVAGNLATTMVPLGIAAQLPIRGAGLAATALNPSTYGAAAATGAAMGALQPTTADESKLVNAGMGAAGGVAGNLAANTIGRIAAPVGEVLSAAHAKAVSTLENAGVPLDATQKSGSAFLGKIKSMLSDNPVTAGGQAAISAEQKAGYNRAVLSTIGADADAATPAVMGASQDRINGVFRDVLGRNKVTLADPVVSRIGEAQAAASIEEKQPIVNMANRILGSVGEDGTIPGQVAYGIKKDLDRLASSPDTGLAFHARQLRSVLMDGINDSLPAADQSAFSEARTQFAKMKTIEGAIDKEGTGNISAPRLSNIMAQKANRQASVYGKGDQDLVDLAHAGNMLLPDKNPNSGTASRVAALLALPTIAGGAEGISSGDWTKAGETALAVGVAPKGLQYLLNKPAVANYLARGIAPGVTRDLLQSPQTNTAIGGAIRRLPQMYLQQKQTAE